MKPETGVTIRPQALDERIYAAIPVDSYIEQYRVNTPEVTQALRENPVLCYLLGSVTPEPVGTDSRPDGVTRPYWLATKGAALFGLKNPEDKSRWSGLFNHIVGAARHAYYLGERIQKATPEQKQKLIALGYDQSLWNSVDPAVLRDMKLIDHAGRRQADEYRWHGVRDEAHPSGDPYVNTMRLMYERDADPEVLYSMAAEDAGFIRSYASDGRLADIRLAILEYSDWTYGQRPVTLTERFRELRESRRATPAVLAELETIGRTFESDLVHVFGESILKNIQNAPEYAWESRIRRAYKAGPLPASS